MADTDRTFTFEISLSVLNHLGRNLYRSFMTVLGEAISNAWDADAHNVWIYLDRAANSLVIKDDGDGMSAEDFQDKFLKIGYSKRRAGATSSRTGRPFIGRKGIGKLALLSCAEKVSVLTRASAAHPYVGGVIDNAGLSDAISQDLTPDEYCLGSVREAMFQRYREDHRQGTILYFEDLHEGIKHTPEYIRKLIALHFRFSLIDDSFAIYVDGKEVTLADIADLVSNTQFVWIINDLDDPLVSEHLAKGGSLHGSARHIRDEMPIRGFIASVEKPSQLKIRTTDEKVSVDLFVNGRLRDKDILRHIPSTRVVESYLYGQVHFDGMDDNLDRFSSSREGIVADDPKYSEFLDGLKHIVAKIMDDWDKLRSETKQDGDPDNPRLSTRDRKARELYNVVSREYDPPPGAKNRQDVNQWVDELADDAQFNFSSYAECFISENLIRKYIGRQGIRLTKEAAKTIRKWKDVERLSKQAGNISIEVRRAPDDLGYLSMGDLANMVDKRDEHKEACLSRDAREYRPIRDALAHTALLTDAAKNKLTTVYENIKARVRTLLYGT